MTVVYSGGDDVFLLGAWNDVVEAALRIRQAFTVFSCGALTISAGLTLVDDHYPVRLSAAASGDLEDLAKQKPDKDAVCLFESAHCYGWNTFTGRVLGEKKAALEAFSARAVKSVELHFCIGRSTFCARRRIRRTANYSSPDMPICLPGWSRRAHRPRLARTGRLQTRCTAGR